MADISEKKYEILKAASECFARFGYEKTTLDDIGRMVGLNKASLYYYYKNKESIFAEVISIEANNFFQTLEDKVRQVADCKAQVLMYVIERLRYLQNVVNLQNISLETVQRMSPIFNDLYQMIFRKEVEFLSSLLMKCLPEDETTQDVNKIASSILTVADAIRQKHSECIGCCCISTADNLQIESDVEFIISLILNGIQYTNMKH